VDGVVDVLIVADPDDQHGTLVADAVRASGGSALRLNLSDLRAVPHRAGVGYLDAYLDGQWQRITSTTTVWWFRLGSVPVDDLAPDEARLVTDEAPYLLRSALAGAAVRWVDDPFDIARAEDKLWQLATATAAGVTIPEAVQTNDRAVVEALADKGPVVAKAVSPGSGIAPFVDLVAPGDLTRADGNPTLFERLVAAAADLRVVTVAGHAWAWRRPRQTGTIDWRAEDPSGQGFLPVDSADLIRTAVRFTAALGLTISVQDWLETGEGPVFLEANPQGAWLFLDRADELVVPALGQHLLQGLESNGRWPRALRRFGYDFMTKVKAPANDGVVARMFGVPSWLEDVATHPAALDTARRAREAAETRARTAEEKANRLVQIVLALLTIAVALGAYQLKFALDHSWPWLASLVPVGLGLAFLALSAFEAAEIDRVGFYRHPHAGDLARPGPRDPAVVLLAGEEEGRRLAAWTADHKLTDLMQAKAWFSRGLAALLIAGAVAASSRASSPATTSPVTTKSSTTSTTATTLTPQRSSMITTQQSTSARQPPAPPTTQP
jgi:hypothetical protein